MEAYPFLKNRKRETKFHSWVSFFIFINYKSFLLDNSNKDCYSVSKVSTTIFSYLHLGHLIKNQTSVSISSVIGIFCNINRIYRILLL